MCSSWNCSFSTEGKVRDMLIWGTMNVDMGFCRLTWGLVKDKMI